MQNGETLKYKLFKKIVMLFGLEKMEKIFKFIFG